MRVSHNLDKGLNLSMKLIMKPLIWKNKKKAYNQ